MWQYSIVTRVELHTPWFSFEMIAPDDPDTVWYLKTWSFKLNKTKIPSNFPLPKFKQEIQNTEICAESAVFPA